MVDDLGTGDALEIRQRLAAEGVKMTSAYAGGNLCSCSRAALMTGQYGADGDIGIFTVLNADATHGLPDAPTTSAEALSAVGYRTWYTGKWHLGELDPFLPQHHGWQSSLIRKSDGTTIRDGLALDPQPTTEQTHDLWTENAIAQMSGTDPWFGYVAFSLMHTPILEKTPLRFRSGGTDTESLHTDALVAVDWAIDAILTALETSGQADNTLVIFTSDNGADKQYGGSNYPLRGTKGTLWEGAIRAPLMARWPGVIAPGQLDATPVIGHDVYHTILDAADAPRPPETAGFGESLLQLWRDGTPLEPRPLFWFRGPDMAVMREGKWKAVQHQAGAPFQLYNLETDPHEDVNKAANQPGRVQSMMGAMRAFAQSIGARGPIVRPKKKKR